MLICTLISVFRPASALEREPVGLGMGSGRKGAGGAGWRGACKGPVACPDKEGSAVEELGCTSLQKVQSMIKAGCDTGLLPFLVPGSLQGHVGTCASKGRLQKP